MPKYFRSKTEQLFAEALASFSIIDSYMAGNLALHATNRMVKIHRKAQERCCRRWQAFTNSL